MAFQGPASGPGSAADDPSGAQRDAIVRAILLMNSGVSPELAFGSVSGLGGAGAQAGDVGLQAGYGMTQTGGFPGGPFGDFNAGAPPANSVPGNPSPDPATGTLISSNASMQAPSPAFDAIANPTNTDVVNATFNTLANPDPADVAAPGLQQAVNETANQQQQAMENNQGFLSSMQQALDSLATPDPNAGLPASVFSGRFSGEPEGAPGLPASVFSGRFSGEPDPSSTPPEGPPMSHPAWGPPAPPETDIATAPPSSRSAAPAETTTATPDAFGGYTTGPGFGGFSSTDATAGPVGLGDPGGFAGTFGGDIAGGAGLGFSSGYDAGVAAGLSAAGVGLGDAGITGGESASSTGIDSGPGASGEGGAGGGGGGAGK